jgi:hypothetical protein
LTVLIPTLIPRLIPRLVPRLVPGLLVCRRRRMVMCGSLMIVVVGRVIRRR